MRFSKAFIPTFKEKPTEAEIPSHSLMIRSGMIRKLGSGIYNYLPLAKRVIGKIESIIRDELNKLGCQELVMPMLQPKNIWDESGRWDVYGPELMRLTDRHNREFALGPTHEEVITLIAKNEIKSYKELPIILYQIQTKFRDEIRPRFGVMRAREFIMKDAYSFHENKKCITKTYQKMYSAYSKIFKRCGLKFAIVEADVGAIGGSHSHEFMVLADTGESEVLSCKCGNAATKENCKIALLKNNKNEKELELKKVHTPEKKSADEVSNFLGIKKNHLIKTIIYKSDDRFVAILIRGDREINDVKVANFLHSTNLDFATKDEIARYANSTAGFVGPIMLQNIEIFADKNLKDMKNMVAGTNEENYHFKNVNLNRDADIKEYSDFILAEENDFCPKCGEKFSSFRGIEVGHIFELGDKYSKSMDATFISENGEKIHYQMGCYGIGITRTMAAAIEQNYDENGIIWPISIAPYQVELINLSTENSEITNFCNRLHNNLKDKKVEILYDDRDVSPGFKFKDADLIGIPIQIIVGKKNFQNSKLEFKIRKTSEKILCKFSDIENKLDKIIDELSQN